MNISIFKLKGFFKQNVISRMTPTRSSYGYSNQGNWVKMLLMQIGIQANTITPVCGIKAYDLLLLKLQSSLEYPFESWRPPEECHNNRYQ